MAAPLHSEKDAPGNSVLRNPLLYSSVILFCAAVSMVFILYMRYESARRYEEQTKARQDAQRHENDLRAVEQLGGSELAIRGFYLSPPIVHSGQSSQLCYDVANATQVKLEPPAGAVWPSHSRCLDVAPKKTTTYTLTITGATGKTVSQSVELRVL